MKLSAKHKKIIIIVVVATIASFITFKLIQRAVFRSRLKKQLVDFSSLNFADIFNETTFQTIEPTISDPVARNIAEMVNSARGWFSDDRTTILSELSKMKNKGDASLVAHMYRVRYSRSFAQDLENMFAKRPADLSALASILNSLN